MSPLRIFAAGLAGCCLVAAEWPGPQLLQMHATATSAGRHALRSADGWWFLAAELHSYGQPGSAWQEPPIAAISTYHRELQARNIRLLVVPVPGKLALEGARLDASWSGGALDLHHQELLSRLNAIGVEALDLTPAFTELRNTGLPPHCRTDSHWSPAGMQCAVKSIASRMGVALTVGTDGGTTASIRINGDLPSMGGASSEEEAIAVRSYPATGNPAPVLLIGDSHLLVYSSGLLATGAGLPEHLGHILGATPVVIANQFDGANQPRATLFRRKGGLDGKRWVIWVFAARTLSESLSGWKMIPCPP